MWRFPAPNNASSLDEELQEAQQYLEQVQQQAQKVCARLPPPAPGVHPRQRVHVPVDAVDALPKACVRVCAVCA